MPVLVAGTPTGAASVRRSAARRDPALRDAELLHLGAERGADAPRLVGVVGPAALDRGMRPAARPRPRSPAAAPPRRRRARRPCPGRCRCRWCRRRPRSGAAPRRARSNRARPPPPSGSGRGRGRSGALGAVALIHRQQAAIHQQAAAGHRRGARGRCVPPGGRARHAAPGPVPRPGRRRRRGRRPAAGRPGWPRRRSCSTRPRMPWSSWTSAGETAKSRTRMRLGAGSRGPA